MVTKKVDISIRLTQLGFKSLIRMANALTKAIRGIAIGSVRLFRQIQQLKKTMFGFKMEMLGIMFFGMAIQKFFEGLIQPALQVAGIFDIITMILQVLFLPIVLALLDPLLMLGEWLMNLSDDTKLWIGKIVLMGVAIGGILYLVGTFVLGLSSILMALAGLALKAGVFMLILDLINPNIKAVDRLKDAFGYLAGILGGFWVKILDNEAVQNFLKNLGLTEEQIESLKHPIAFIKEKFKTMWDEFKAKAKKALDDLKINLPEIFKTFILKLVGMKEWSNLTDKWDEFKTAADNSIKAVDKLWNTIRSLDIPKGVLEIIKLGGKLAGGVSDFIEERPRQAAALAVTAPFAAAGPPGWIAILAGQIITNLEDIALGVRDPPPYMNTYLPGGGPSQDTLDRHTGGTSTQ